MSFVVPNFVRPEFGTMFQKEVPLFIEITEFLSNTAQDRSKKAPMPKISSIHLVVSIELLL